MTPSRVTFLVLKQVERVKWVIKINNKKNICNFGFDYLWTETRPEKRKKKEWTED